MNFHTKKRQNKAIILQRKKKGFFIYEKRDVFGKDIWTEMHLIIFFPPFSPPPFFSGSHLKQHINKCCPGWCFLSWCSRASPCPAGAAFHTSPCRTKSPSPQAQWHMTCGCARAQGGSVPQGFAGCLCQPCRVDGAQGAVSQLKPTSAQTLRRPVASPPLWPVSPCMCKSRALWTAGN